MAPLRWRLLPLAILLLLVAGLAIPDAIRAAAPHPEQPEAPLATEPVTLELSQMREDPLAHVGRRVRFTVQFCGSVETWNPLTTRFGAGEWSAFSGWSDERFTWDRSVYEDPFPRLFVRRDGALHRVLSEARTFERFLITGTLREVLLGHPWIEVDTMQPLSELVGEGTIMHVTRAQAFARRGQWRLATEQFERARSAPLPANARKELDRRIAECNRLRGL